MASLLVPGSERRWEWESEESYLLLNPRFPGELKSKIKKLESVFPRQTSSMGIFSSGSRSLIPKCVELRKSSFLHAARSLGQKFDFQPKEVWLNPLPTFHVGGLSIFARAHVFQQKVICLKSWEPLEFVRILAVENINWTSLVPTQVFDLVVQNLKPPQSLRGVFVGGGALSEDLYGRGRKLGWPLLPSFGMTETSSQLATASLASLESTPFPALEVLPHFQIQTSPEGGLSVKGEGVAEFAWNWRGNGWEREPLRGSEGWYRTQDRVRIRGNQIHFLGRVDDQVKVGGELLSLAKLQAQLEALLRDTSYPQQALVLLLPDSRLEYRPVLVLESSCADQGASLLSRFNLSVSPFERLREIYYISQIPRSDLGKPKISVLQDQLKIQ